jgi:hypothetical protein
MSTVSSSQSPRLSFQGDFDAFRYGWRSIRVQQDNRVESLEQVPVTALGGRIRGLEAAIKKQSSPNS